MNTAVLLLSKLPDSIYKLPAFLMRLFDVRQASAFQSFASKAPLSLERSMIAHPPSTKEE